MKCSNIPHFPPMIHSEDITLNKANLQSPHFLTDAPPTPPELHAVTGDDGEFGDPPCSFIKPSCGEVGGREWLGNV